MSPIRIARALALILSVTAPTCKSYGTPRGRLQDGHCADEADIDPVSALMRHCSTDRVSIRSPQLGQLAGRWRQLAPACDAPNARLDFLRYPLEAVERKALLIDLVRAASLAVAIRTGRACPGEISPSLRRRRVPNANKD